MSARFLFPSAATRKLQNYLRMYRKRFGFSQDELAFLLSCHSGATMSRYEARPANGAGARDRCQAGLNTRLRKVLEIAQGPTVQSLSYMSVQPGGVRHESPWSLKTSLLLDGNCNWRNLGSRSGV
jgi:hypothetical protein